MKTGDFNWIVSSFAHPVCFAVIVNYYSTIFATEYNVGWH